MMAFERGRALLVRMGKVMGAFLITGETSSVLIDDCQKYGGRDWFISSIGNIGGFEK